jgi:hypothetical protein
MRGGGIGAHTVNAHFQLLLYQPMITVQDKQLKDKSCTVVNGFYLSFKNAKWS